MKKYCILYGTRPEIIKLAPIIFELERLELDYFCVHSGQHYSYEMDEIFFKELNLPVPKYNLGIGSLNLTGHGTVTGAIMSGFEKILLNEKPSILIVQGDTNTVLAGALVASKVATKNKIKTAHVEAGLRSYDKSMPEEINRILTDHISDFLFAPTNKEKDILLSEGIRDDAIHVVGNTIVDSVLQFKDIASTNSRILEKLNLTHKRYILLTCHRQENTDNETRLKSIINGAEMCGAELSLPIVFLLHPRTANKITEYNIQLPENFITINSVGYLDALHLQSNSKIVLTDSGGLQEEALVLGVPCVTLRDNTERPEAVNVGANIVAGVNSENIKECCIEMISKSTEWANPFGNGDTAKLIIEYIQNHDK